MAYFIYCPRLATVPLLRRRLQLTVILFANKPEYRAFKMQMAVFVRHAGIPLLQLA